MSRTLKIIGIVIVVLILLVVIAPFLIPVNHFRPEIERRIDRYTANADAAGVLDPPVSAAAE